MTVLFIEFWKNKFEPSLLENKEPHDKTRRTKEDDDEVDDDVDHDGEDDKDDEDNDDGENIDDTCNLFLDHPVSHEYLCKILFLFGFFQ